MSFHVGVPQALFLSFYLLVFMHTAMQHKEPRTGKVDAYASLGVILTQLSVLYWGGFFA